MQTFFVHLESLICYSLEKCLTNSFLSISLFYFCLFVCFFTSFRYFFSVAQCYFNLWIYQLNLIWYLIPVVLFVIQHSSFFLVTRASSDQRSIRLWSHFFQVCFYDCELFWLLYYTTTITTIIFGSNNSSNNLFHCCSYFCFSMFIDLFLMSKKHSR